MKLDAFCERYCLDARSFEEKNARSLALGKERLAAGKTGQAMRLFAYNHALNQNRLKTSAQAGTGTKWKVRVWKNNKVVKTLTVEKDDEPFVTAKVKSLGVDWDKATVHDPKTMKQQKNYKNANASKAENKSSQPARKLSKIRVQFNKPISFGDVTSSFLDIPENFIFGGPVSELKKTEKGVKEICNSIKLKMLGTESGTDFGRKYSYDRYRVECKGEGISGFESDPAGQKFSISKVTPFFK